MSDEKKFNEPRVRSEDEATTRRRIAVGTLIEVRRSVSSWPAAVALDVEATPVVGTSTLLKLSEGFARATVGWRADREGETTRRWTAQAHASPPPPMVQYLAPFAALLPPARVERRTPRMPAIAVGSALLFFLFATIHSQGAKPVAASHASAATGSPLVQTPPQRSPFADEQAPVRASVPPPADAPIVIVPNDREFPAGPPAPPTPAKRAVAAPADLLAAADDALARGQLERARSSYATALARSPRDVEAISGLGDVAQARGEAAQALASYERALAIDPGFRPAWTGRAQVLRAMALTAVPGATQAPRAPRR